MNTRRFFSALLNEYPISVRRRNKGTDIFWALSNQRLDGWREL